MNPSPDPYGNLNALKAEYERAEWTYRELSRRLDDALTDSSVSADTFAEINTKRMDLLNRMKSIQIRLSKTNYG